MDAAIDDLLERHQGAMTKAEYVAAATEIQALILAERERCAKIAVGYIDQCPDSTYQMACRAISDAIRNPSK